jgi:hypothetical protein
VNTYPVIKYPKSILSALPFTNSVSTLSGKSPKQEAISTSQKIAVPRSRYLRDFPWYLGLVLLLAANLVVYQVVNLPVLIILGIIGAGLLVKYAIDHYHWIKRHKLAIKRSRVPEHRPPAEERNTTSRVIYPIWEQVCQPVTSTLASEAQVGVSEQYFLDHLQRYFPSASFGRRFSHPDRQEKYWYSSDIEIIVSGLGLQVEIDEPYAGKNGRPHHCADHRMDNQRDLFFLDRNWIIIRFAEIQVVSEPVACCSVVAKVITQLTGETSYINLIGKTDPLKKVGRWTEKEAKRMAKEDFRHTYLKPAGLWNGS